MTRTTRKMAQTATLALAMALGTAAAAGTFGELSGGAPGGMPGGMPGGLPAYAAGPYAGAPVYCPPNCIAPGMAPGMPPMQGAPMRGGPEGVPPMDPGASPDGPFIPSYAAQPRAYLPFRQYADGPNAPVMLWSFGQLNAGTDPFDPYGLSTPYMHVPWSTPLAGWTNAQTWNWWRERSSALPRNW